MITIYRHDACLDHDPGPHHPENADRLRSIMTALEEAPFKLQTEYVDAPLGTDDQVLLAHASSHLDLCKLTSPKEGRRPLDSDTVMSTGSFEAAMRAVGAACQGVDDLMRGQTRHVFCATRPPGHHATPSRPMGFCIFNQIAIAALHAMHVHKLERVAVVDFDVHHGNGTQDILQGKTGMLYLSTHQSPLYPGTGRTEENRKGNIHNVPLFSGMNDRTYQEIFSDEVLPELDEFKPQLLFVSAGFDAHARDPLASVALTETTYEWLGQRLRGAANKHAGGKLLSVLEGGYNLEVLGDSVAAYLKGTLADQKAI